MIQLFDDQNWLVGRARESLAKHNRVLVQSPTGSGKTVMFSYMTGRARERGRRVGIFAHRAELTRQISAALARFNIPHGFIAAGATYVPGQSVYVVSAGTYARRIEKMPIFDFGIVDEAHHATDGSTWGKCMEHSPDAKWLGVSATPERLDGRGLGEMFDDLVIGLSIRELMDKGRLCDYRLFAPAGPDLSGVHTVAGDFNRGELAAAMDRKAITGDAVRHYTQHLRGAPSVAFCTSVAHAAHVAEEFRAAGYVSAHVDGGMDDAERGRVIGDFRAGRIHVLSSCDLISEGFDVPGIHGAILLRPTQSLALYLQQVGRAFRVEAGKERAIILDHAGNSVGPNGHGLPDADRQWSLEGRDRRAKKPVDESVRQCERCFCAYASRLHVCPECGWMPAPKPRTVETVDGVLEEVDLAAQRERERLEAEQRRRERGMARTPEQFAALGVSEPAANHILAARQEKDALRENLYKTAREVAFRTGWHEMYRAFSKPAIKPLKPAALRLLIADMREVLRETEDERVKANA